ncbi:hypothetical protein GYA37_00345 [candidate division WWE3 bacterium]|uniref:Uncharacterized protein n=1 Tax=candidate division WWE3 bacterium TaxID=2053526 RepID=A0A7X9E6B2_UNCKA|nr:hypothetical protein [candidate division WWE3 bacterium]
MHVNVLTVSSKGKTRVRKIWKDDKTKKFSFGRIFTDPKGLCLEVKKPFLQQFFCFFRKILGLGCIRIEMNRKAVKPGKKVILEPGENRLVYKIVKSGNTIVKERNVINVTF